MHLDYGFAEARVTGGIPTFATVTAGTDEAGATRGEHLPGQTGVLLTVPGLRPDGQERITVSVTRGARSEIPACRCQRSAGSPVAKSANQASISG
ncbi:hypothetical protein [Streptomyces sp. NPDC055692]|uniref:hypothetical protein n=1 Tax=Streptomyces sp. NPDC055692 TaxID=3155683 RepID=UPI00344539EE